MTNIEIGLRIKQAREEANLTLEDIATRIGVAKSTIQRYEKGKIENIKIPIIQSIANVLGVNPSWLIGKSNIKVIPKPQYYTDEKTAKMAQEMFEDPDMRSLFDMKHNMDPDKFKLHVDYLRKMYKLEHPEDDDDGGC